MITKAPEQIDTARLLLRRPRATDADAVFTRYASDAEVTRYVGWPQHHSLEDTRAFLAWSDAEWERWPCGPYLIFDSVNAKGEMQNAKGVTGITLLGGTGLAFETSTRAMTGYIFAKDAWGRGYATEALRAMIDLARGLGVTHLFALCNADHRPSWHVLEKAGLAREAAIRSFEFPNLAPGRPLDTFCYSIEL